MEGKKQLFRDKNLKPTEQLIAESLGEGYVIYQRFIETLENEGISLMDWRYYQDGKAWLSKGEYKWTTTRGTNKVNPFFGSRCGRTSSKSPFTLARKSEHSYCLYQSVKRQRKPFLRRQLMTRK